MKVLLVLTLAIVAAGVAVADAYGWNGCTLAVFFDEDWTQTNTNVPAGQVPMYLVLLNPDAADPNGLRAVEAGLRLPANAILVSTAVPAGGDIDGPINNFFLFWTLAGPALPVASTGTLAATFNIFITSGDQGVIELGPGNPASIGGTLVLVNHDNTLLIAAGWATGYAPPEDPSGIDINDPDPWFRPIATINGEGVVATEERTLSGVKSLFR